MNFAHNSKPDAIFIHLDYADVIDEEEFSLIKHSKPPIGMVI